MDQIAGVQGSVSKCCHTVFMVDFVTPEVINNMAVELSVAYDVKLVAKLLRGLALDVEANPILAPQIIDALAVAGLLRDEAEDSGNTVEIPIIDSASPGSSLSPASSFSPSTLINLQAARIDLLNLCRIGGVDQVRARLAMLDISTLRRIIQLQDLDPEKKMAKSRSVPKLIEFIATTISAQVEQELELAKTASWML
jgi:hypothetical protein